MSAFMIMLDVAMYLNPSQALTSLNIMGTPTCTTISMEVTAQGVRKDMRLTSEMGVKWFGHCL